MAAASSFVQFVVLFASFRVAEASASRPSEAATQPKDDPEVLMRRDVQPRASSAADAVSDRVSRGARPAPRPTVTIYHKFRHCNLVGKVVLTTANNF